MSLVRTKSGREEVVMRMEDGDYVAYIDDIRRELKHNTKMQLIRRLYDIFPEMFQTRHMGSHRWTVAKLKKRPAYELAIILNQCR